MRASCPRCGFASEGSRFCSNCGLNLETEAPAQEPAHAQHLDEADREGSETAHRHSRLGLFALFGLVLLTGAAVAAWQIKTIDIPLIGQGSQGINKVRNNSDDESRHAACVSSWNDSTNREQQELLASLVAAGAPVEPVIGVEIYEGPSAELTRLGGGSVSIEPGDCVITGTTATPSSAYIESSGSWDAVEYVVTISPSALGRVIEQGHAAPNAEFDRTGLVRLLDRSPADGSGGSPDAGLDQTAGGSAPENDSTAEGACQEFYPAGRAGTWIASDITVSGGSCALAESIISQYLGQFSPPDGAGQEVPDLGLEGGWQCEGTSPGVPAASCISPDGHEVTFTFITGH